MAATARAHHRFTVKEGTDGPFIAFELSGGEELPAIRNGMLSFDLLKGTDIKRAHEIAKMLNGSVTATALTTF